MVCQHQKIDAIPSCRRNNLFDGPSPVMGVIGVQMNRSCIIICLEDEEISLLLESRLHQLFSHEHLLWPLSIRPVRPVVFSTSTVCAIRSPVLSHLHNRENHEVQSSFGLPVIFPRGHEEHRGVFLQKSFAALTSSAWYWLYSAASAGNLSMKNL